VDELMGNSPQNQTYFYMGADHGAAIIIIVGVLILLSTLMGLILLATVPKRKRSLNYQSFLVTSKKKGFREEIESKMEDWFAGNKRLFMV
jgi:hypothetical protein